MVEVTNQLEEELLFCKECEHYKNGACDKPRDCPYDDDLK